MPANSPFASSHHLNASSFKLNNILPPDTHLTGKLAVVWSIPAASTTPCLRLAIECSLPTSLGGDYVPFAETARSTTTYRVKLMLLPSDANLKDWTDVVAKIQAEQTELQKCLSYEFTISTDGMQVTEVEGDKVGMEGKGERRLECKNRVMTVFADTKQPSATPSWFTSPPPSVSSPTHHPIIHRQVERFVKGANVIRMKPLSDLIPPTINLAKSRAIHKSNQPNMGGKKAAAEDAQKEQRNGENRDAGREIESGKRSLSIDTHGQSDQQPEKRRKSNGALIPFEREASALTGASEVAVSPRWQHPANASPERPTIDMDASNPLPNNVDADRTTEDPSSPANDFSVSSHVEAHKSLSLSPFKPATSRTEHPRQGLSHSQSAPSLSSMQAGPSTQRLPDRTGDLRARRKEVEARARQEAEERRAAEQEREREATSSLAALSSDFSVNGIGYRAIKNLRNNETTSVMGIILQVQPPKKSRDWTTSIVITDPSVHTGDSASEDMVVSVFRPDQRQLTMPPPGSPILFRRLKVLPYNGKLKGNAFSNSGNTWANLEGDSLKVESPSLMIPPLDKQEVDRLIALRQWWLTGGGAIDSSMEAGTTYIDAGVGSRRTNLQGRPMARHSTASTTGDSAKMGLITLGEVEIWKFFHAVFKILYIDRSCKVAMELYITDGTASSYPNRNFRGVTHEDLLPSQIFVLSIVKEPPPDEQPLYREGLYMKMNNIRAKEYRGELELTWSEAVTQDQLDQGWNRRRVTGIAASDPQAKLIEERIRRNRNRNSSTSPIKPVITRDEFIRSNSIVPSVASRRSSVMPSPIAPQVVHIPPIVEPKQTPTERYELATQIHTTYVDPIDHPLSTIPRVLSNATLPNRFRVHARVKSVHARVAGGDSLIQRHCKKCKRGFVKPYCESCHDVRASNAEYRYRFIIMLESPTADSETGEADVLPVLIADEDAASFLPGLPPLTPSTNPNDATKSQRQLSHISKSVSDLLLGPRLDGVRTMPVFDWSVESYVVKLPKGFTAPGGKVSGQPGAGAGAGRGVVVWRVFGMVAE